jgi:hypothetical protein
VLLYAFTLFLGAGLLFVVQPMVGKMVLPLLGGTPAVWSTCLVFFQTTLLAGYAYAHASTAVLGPSRQAIVHLVVLALPLAVLPLGIDARLLRGGEANPVFDVLRVLSLSVGLPLLVVSATAPLLQKWFSRTRYRAAGDPYVLYAASNLGSMLALLGYPSLIEPRLPLRQGGWLSQTALWSTGYVALAVLIALCAWLLWRAGAGPVAAAGADVPRATADGPRAAAAGVPSDALPADPVDGLTDRDRLRWVALAFVPSSLLLGATTYITTDLAAVPLLWVLPLAVYLLTFILAFGRWPSRLHRIVVAATLPAVLVGIFLMVSEYRLRIWTTILCHVALLLVVALACHGELALRRPPPRRLTEYYLWIAVGGALGGLFNALVAPNVFTSLVEYPLAMVLACVLMARPRRVSWEPALNTALLTVELPLVVAALAFMLYSDSFTVRFDFGFINRVLALPTGVTEWITTIERSVNKVLAFGPPLVICFLLRRRPVVLGLALIGVLVAAGYVDARKHDLVRQSRSFFGVLRVSRDRDEKGYTELRHGTTLHGRQSLDPARRTEPLSYYHRAGPIAQVVTELEERGTALRTAVVGLGTGTMAAFARMGDTMTIYEIDRLVRDIAFDPTYFTYLADARARGALLRVELGDARIRLDAVRRERPGERYDLIVVDAFTSDAIPVHLLTREALQLYLEMLAPDGIIAFHISNRYLKLEPVVANLAADAKLGGRLLMDEAVAETDGGIESTWVMLSRTADALGPLLEDERWATVTLETDPRVGIWTDDFHNLVSVFNWR